MLNLKITFLTQTVLDDFVRKFDVGSLTDEQAREVEHLAYCACIGSSDNVYSRFRFLDLLRSRMGISLTLEEVYS